MALGLTAFWSGFWAGVNYAASFVLIMLLHWTVATKQPAMTAPAMAQRLGDLKSDDSVEAFVDDVAHLMRSQAAGIFGNLALCAPLVLAAQWLAWWLLGAPLVGAARGRARAGHADAARARRRCTPPSPACCCSPAR